MYQILFILWALLIFSFFYSWELRKKKTIILEPDLFSNRKNQFYYIKRLGMISLCIMIVYLLLIRVLLGWEFRWYYFSYIFFTINLLILDRYLLAVNYAEWEKKGHVEYINIQIVKKKFRIKTKAIGEIYSILRGAYSFLSIGWFVLVLLVFNSKMAFSVGNFKVDDFITAIKPKPQNAHYWRSLQKFPPMTTDRYGIAKSQSFFSDRVILSYHIKEYEISKARILVSRRRMLIFKKPLFYVSVSSPGQIQINKSNDSLLLGWFGWKQDGRWRNNMPQYITTETKNSRFGFYSFSKERKSLNDNDTSPKRVKYKLFQKIFFN